MCNYINKGVHEIRGLAFGLAERALMCTYSVGSMCVFYAESCYTMPLVAI